MSLATKKTLISFYLDSDSSCVIIRQQQTVARRLPKRPHRCSIQSSGVHTKPEPGARYSEALMMLKMTMEKLMQNCLYSCFM